MRPAFFAPGSVGDENRVVRRTETVLEQVAHDHVGLFGNKLAAHGVFEVLRFGGKAYDFLLRPTVGGERFQDVRIGREMDIEPVRSVAFLEFFVAALYRRHGGEAVSYTHLDVYKRQDDPQNKVYPGQFKYGGAHVIEDLVAGRSVHLRATSYGTDCYPRRSLDRTVTLADLTCAQLLNPRNCYQNYNAAVNCTSRTIYTYMGPLKPDMRNVNFATAGCLSPLFNDPWFRTIGTGTRIFLGGGQGYVIGAGTQHDPSPQRTEKGLPLSGSGTLMVRGDLKGMKPRYLRGLSLTGYGVSLSVGVGIPIPILNEEMAAFTGVSNEDILMPVKDYGYDSVSYTHLDVYKRQRIPSLSETRSKSSCLSFSKESRAPVSH